MVTFLTLNILVFYFEWRLALYLLFNFPLAFIGTALIQRVIIYKHNYAYFISYSNAIIMSIKTLVLSLVYGSQVAHPHD